MPAPGVPPQERTTDRGTPTQHPLFPRVHEHGSAQAKSGTTTGSMPGTHRPSAGGPAFVQMAQFNVILADVRVRVQASRVQGPGEV